MRIESQPSASAASALSSIPIFSKPQQPQYTAFRCFSHRRKGTRWRRRTAAPKTSFWMEQPQDALAALRYYCYCSATSLSGGEAAHYRGRRCNSTNTSSLNSSQYIQRTASTAAATSTQTMYVLLQRTRVCSRFKYHIWHFNLVQSSKKSAK